MVIGAAFDSGKGVVVVSVLPAERRVPVHPVPAVAVGAVVSSVFAVIVCRAAVALVAAVSHVGAHVRQHVRVYSTPSCAGQVGRADAHVPFWQWGAVVDQAEAKILGCC